MSRYLRLDLSQLTVHPDPSLGKLVSAGARTRRSPTERTMMKASLELAKPLNSSLASALEVIEISERPPTVTVVPSPTVPMASHTSFDLTAAVGLTGTAGWVAGLNTVGGVYGSTTLEFGVFGTAGFVIGVVAGAGGGIEYTLVFGTPRDFAGPFVCFQASVGPKIFGGLAVGGSLLFSLGPATPTGRAMAFQGFTVNLTGGWSALPASVSVEWSNTWIKPLIK